MPSPRKKLTRKRRSEKLTKGESARDEEIRRKVAAEFPPAKGGNEQKRKPD